MEELNFEKVREASKIYMKEFIPNKFKKFSLGNKVYLKNEDKRHKMNDEYK